MMDRLQAFLFFCEDFRVEVGEKPMVLGILSPLFHTAPNPGVSDRVYSVTAVTAPAHVNTVKLVLKIAVSQPDSPDEEETYRQTLIRPADLPADDMWSTYLPLPVAVTEWMNGTRITAHLTANDVEAFSYLRPSVEEEKEEPQEVAQPLRKERRARQKK